MRTIPSVSEPTHLIVFATACPDFYQEECCDIASATQVSGEKVFASKTQCYSIHVSNAYENWDITSMTFDKKGNLWCATLAGIAKITFRK